MGFSKTLGDAAAAYGTVVVWKSIIGGSVLILLLSGGLVWLMRYHHNYRKTNASITDKVSCRLVTTGTETMYGKTKQMTAYACVAPIKFSVNGKQYNVQLNFTQKQPFSDKTHTILVEYDPSDPGATVQTPSTLEKNRHVIEAGLVAIIVITLASVVVSVIFRNNRAYRQGTAAIDVGSRVANVI